MLDFTKRRWKYPGNNHVFSLAIIRPQPTQHNSVGDRVFIRRYILALLWTGSAGLSNACLADDPMRGNSPGSYTDLSPITSKLFPVADGWLLSGYGHIRDLHYWGAAYTWGIGVLSILPTSPLNSLSVCPTMLECKGHADTVNFEMRDEARRCHHRSSVTQLAGNGPASLGITYEVDNVSCTDDWDNPHTACVPSAAYPEATRNPANEFYEFVYEKNGIPAGFPRNKFSELRAWLLQHGWTSASSMDPKARYRANVTSNDGFVSNGMLDSASWIFAHIPSPPNGNMCFLGVSLLRTEFTTPFSQATFTSCCGPLGKSENDKSACGYAVKKN